MLRQLSHSIRTLARNRGFTTVTVLTLALGIGATTAIFSVVNGVLLNPLPYLDQDRAAVVVNTWEEGRINLSDQEFRRYQTLDAFERVGAYDFRTLNLTGGDRAERLLAAAISVDVLPLLGGIPVLGRGFAEEDDIPGAPRVALLANGLWRRRFAADPNVVGRVVTIGGNPVTVVGIMPAAFRLPVDFIGSPVELYVPLRLGTPDPRNLHYLNGLARLGANVTLAQGQSALASEAVRLKEEIGTLPETFSTTLIPVNEVVVGSIRPALLILLAAGVLVLFVASVNVASLMLARTDMRKREMAVRRALGASSGNLAAILGGEVAVLASAGAAAGLLLAYWGTRALISFAPPGLPRKDAIAIDGSVLTFAIGATIAAALIFGLLPALRAARPGAQETLHGGVRGGTTGRSRQQARRVLVVAEIAMAVTLAIGAGLMMKSSARLNAVDLGFAREGTLTFRVNLPESIYGDAGSARRFYASLLGTVRDMPGVTEAGATRSLPLAYGTGDWGIRIRGTGEDGLGERGPNADWHVATDGFFEAMEIPLIEGRYLREDDRSDNIHAVVINETMARQYWPNGSAIGAQFRMTTDIDTIWRSIVGVVGDVKQNGAAADVNRTMYLPHAQFPSTANFPVGAMTVVVRGRALPSLVQTIVAEVRALDANVPVSQVQMMEDVVRRAGATQRFQKTLFSLFALTALALVVVGVYGVMNFLVSQRTRELGIRIALGASQRRVLQMVMGEGLTLTALGIGVGVLGAFGLSQFLASLLFGVETHDAQTFLTTPLVVCLAAMVAAFIPARRATLVEPVETLREE